MTALLIFDWDGTILDSRAKIVNCLQVAAKDTGLSVPLEDECRQVIGLGLREALEQLIPNQSQAIYGELANAYREAFFIENQEVSRLFPEVEDTFQRFTDEGIIMAIATGKSRRGLNRDLEDTGLGHYFTASRCADECFSKPHPQMALELLNELGMKAEQALVIGDTEYDIKMAKNAGIAALAVSWGVHELSRLKAAGPVASVDSFSQIYHWVTSGE